MSKIQNKIYLAALGVMTLFLASCFKEAVNESIGILNDHASIYTVRNMYKGSDLNLNEKNLGGAKYTGGIVISDRENGNFPEGYIAIESVWRGQVRGIVVEAPNAAEYRFGDSVLVKIDGAKLTRKNGPLAIAGLKAGDITVLAQNKKKTHRAVSISALNANPELFESTLIGITADVENLSPGATLAGKHLLSDGSGNEINLFTLESAKFSDVKLAPNASFMGIFSKDGNAPVLYMQKAEDMANPSGKIYGGWPETFENPSVPKGSYDMPDINNNVAFSTGEWNLYFAIVADTKGRDRIVSGEKAIRLQQNRDHDEYLQMNFDVPEGASKVTFWYGSYYNDRSSTFRLEYSVDQGETWQQLGEDISDAHTFAQSPNSKQAVFMMDIQKPVRFRINKLGLGVSSPTVSNGRLGIDDFAIYKSY